MYTKEFITKGIDTNKPIIVDTETIGLYGRTRLIQIRQESIHYEYDCFYINIETIKHFLKPCHLVFHNAIYDLSCPDFKQWIPKKIDDTLLIMRLQFPFLNSFDLKSLSKEILKLDKGDEGSSDWGSYNLTNEQLEYSANDTYLTEELYKLTYKETLEHQSYLLDIDNIEYACIYQWKGMRVSKNNCKELLKEAKNKLKSINNIPEDLNVNSPKQVKEFLNLESSSKDVLLELSITDHRADSILEKRKLLKQISYIEDIIDKPFITSHINPVGAISGRFTSKSINEDSYNLQQIPRELKKMFAMDNTGYYVCADYPALEIWICACVIDDDFLVNTLKNKEDLHSATAKKLFNRENITKAQRMVGKASNFGLLYGTGAERLRQLVFNYSSKEVRLTLQEAQTHKSNWLKTFKGIALWQKNIFNEFRNSKHGFIFVQTPLGKVIKVDSPIKGMNYQIQGGGAECTKLALHLLKNEGIIPANTVHDSIALIASSYTEAQEYKEILSKSMEESFKRVTSRCKNNTLSLQVTAEISDSYC